MTRQIVVTTSWDDGHPTDRRLADLLCKYRLPATFYVPSTNSEGRPVLVSDDVRAISELGMELGGHTRDHIDLTNQETRICMEQLRQNRTWLEHVSGKEVNGFCYVRGRYNQRIKKLVKQEGFAYARSVRNLCGSIGTDRYSLGTTIQVYPHAQTVYLRNFVRHGPALDRLKLLPIVLWHSKFRDRLRRVIEVGASGGEYIHVWGHSWEITEYNLWKEVEELFAQLAAIGPNTLYLTNMQAVQHFFSKQENENTEGAVASKPLTQA